MNVLDFRKAKAEGRKLSMLTCYDHWSAKILNETEVDALLVGDSVAMVVHGHPTTLHADVEMMRLHTSAVTRGAPAKLVVADMPFLSFRKGIHSAVEAAGILMRAGAHAVKIEGVEGHDDVIRHVVDSGIPVMGHLGLTPQSVHQMGGFKVQGKNSKDADRILEEARRLEQLGCFSVVLECVPAKLAELVTKSLSIPTIGIGAGPENDGQILVLQDMLGTQTDFTPKFLKRYADLQTQIRGAVKKYHSEVLSGTFPSPAESYS